MFKLAKEGGLKPPLISLDEGFRLINWRLSAVTGHDAGHGTGHDTDHDTDHDVKGNYTEIPELAHRLVLIVQDDMSRVQLMNILELKSRSHFVKNYLDPALTGGFVEMTISEKSKSQHQRYRLTSKGMALKP